MGDMAARDLFFTPETDNGKIYAIHGEISPPTGSIHQVQGLVGGYPNSTAKIMRIGGIRIGKGPERRARTGRPCS